MKFNLDDLDDRPCPDRVYFYINEHENEGGKDEGKEGEGEDEGLFKRHDGAVRFTCAGSVAHPPKLQEHYQKRDEKAP